MRYPSARPWQIGAFCLLLAAVAAAQSVPATVQLLYSGTDRVRLAYMAEPAASHNQRAWTAYGGHALVGVPPGAQVRLEVVEKTGARTLDDSGSGGLRVDGPAWLGPVGQVRDQRVVGVGFGPERQPDGSLQAYERVVADVFFEGGRSGARRGRSDRLSEDLLRRSVVNYDQARRWRLGRRRAAAKALQGPTGQAVKITLRERGMYRVSGQQLIDAGASLDGVEASGVGVFYGSGRMLAESWSAAPWAGLEAVDVVVEDGGDGRFDAEDFVLFYGEGVARWEYDGPTGDYFYRRNFYTDDNAYWLVLDSPDLVRRMEALNGAPTDPAAIRPDSYRERLHEESDNFILIQTFQINSGYEWYWQDFARNARNFSLFLTDVAEAPARVKVRFWGTSAEEHPFQFKWNDEVLETQTFTGVRTHTFEVEVPQGVTEGQNLLGVVHLNNKGTRLDWFEVEYGRQFVAQRGELVFDAPVVEQAAQYRVGGFSRRPRVFAVEARPGAVSTATREVVDFAFDEAAGEVVFEALSGARPARYILAEADRWKRPLELAVRPLGQLRRSDRGADYVIITHSDFAVAAQRLADWRSADDRFGPPLRTEVVDVEQVYDDFAGGLIDPAAIRNFVRYAYENWDPAPLFIGLMGDGSYDYKNNSGNDQPFWIPAYQDGDSTYDEWYVRVAGGDEFPDLAIGRMPVQTPAEAEALVDKILAYDQAPEIGPWQSRVLLVADDLVNPSLPGQIENFFLIDAEIMAASFLPEDLDLNKLYLARFPLEGNSKPRARDEFIRLFNQGALILTYLGHGNPDVLAHEQLFRLSRDFGDVANGRRLPFIYTAASQVGVFDDPQRQSMPEALVLKPDGGAIGMISATRIGFHDSNMILARQFHEQMYRSGRQHVPLGLALMEGKQLVRSSERDRRNIQRYSLLGDPAQRLARPPYQVEIEMPDTLRALEEVEISGRILDGAGQPADGYQGRARVQVFDSAVSSLLEGYGYQQLGGPLFRGLVDVEGGRFATRFRLPKDITYRERRGRASAYVWSRDGGPTAFGARDRRVLAGTAPDAPVDAEGPQIQIAFQGRNPFVSGDKVPPRPVLQAVLRDPSGINITGEIGHEIELNVDGQVFRVTEFFLTQPGGYDTGVVEYPLPQLEPGEYTVRLKAWDAFNNSSQTQVQIVVEEGGGFAISDVLVYPNPIRQQGHFTYALGAPARAVRVEVFALSGRLVDAFDGGVQAGYNQVAWDKPVDLANGTYLFRVSADLEDGGRAEKTAALQVVE